MRAARWTALVVAAGMGLPAAPAVATTYTVSGTTDPASPSCSATVCQSLRAAVAAANADAGSTIQLGAATYTLSQGALSVNATTTISGAGANLTTIHQTAADRVLLASVHSATVDISGVTISGGTVTGAAGGTGAAGADAYGAGIYSLGTMTLTDVVLTGNSVTGGAGGFGPSGQGGGGGSAFGGAIASVGSIGSGTSLTLVSVRVTGNTTTGGAGGSSATSQAGRGGVAGGAVYGTFAAVTLQHSTVSDNHVTGGGGGSAAINLSATANKGGEADGAVDVDGQLEIDDSTISANSVTGGAGGEGTDVGKGADGGPAFGGGVLSTSSTIRRTTLAGNTAAGGAGGNSDISNPGQGGSAFGGGLAGYLSAQQRVVDSTIVGNIAAAGAPGSGNGSAAGQAVAHGGGYSGSGGSNAGLFSSPVSAGFDSTTIASNEADGHSLGGNVAAEGYGGVGFTDTIVVAGTGSGLTSGTGNCGLVVTLDPDVNPTLADGGHNLEDTTPSQCGFSADKSDRVGAVAALGALADNGGPTQTLALLPGSAALGSGGTCTDLDGQTPLAVDQRGLPRPASGCDIGAYQLQPPIGTGAPQLTGDTTVSCSLGSWTGDQLAFARQWLRDGSAIAGADGADYTIAAADAGHALSCRVTASNVRGSADQTSDSRTVPGGAPSGGSGAGEAISGVGETHAIWVEGKKLPRIARTSRHPIGTVFRFTLSVPGSVTFTFRRAVRRHHTTRLVVAGRLKFAGHAGANRVAFQGRLSRSHKLPLGRYTLTIVAIDAAGHASAPARLRFRIVRR